MRSPKIQKILEMVLNQLKEVSKQKEIWADMSVYCQDDWEIDFQSLDPFSAVELISFHNNTGYNLVINVGSLKTYNQFTDSSLMERVIPVLRNIITLIMSNDLAKLKEYVLNITTQRGSGCYLFEIKKIDEIDKMPNDIIKIHYY